MCKLDDLNCDGRDFRRDSTVWKDNSAAPETSCTASSSRLRGEIVEDVTPDLPLVEATFFFLTRCGRRVNGR